MSYPKTISSFHAYLFRAYPWMRNNATRLDISSEQIAELKAIVGDDVTPGTYFYHAKLYNAAPKRKATILVTNLSGSTKATKKKITEILEDTAASKWTNEDRLIFNRKKGLPRKQTKPTSKIAFECVVDHVPARNGVIDFKAKPRSETKRSQLAEGSDAVEMNYAVVQSDIRKSSDMLGKVLEQCIGIDDHTKSKVFYKAKFQFSVDQALIGFDLHCWFRFIKTRYPKLAGKWSDRQIIRII